MIHINNLYFQYKGKFDDVNEDFLILYDGEVLNQDTGSISNFSFDETEINLNRFSTQKITDFKIQEDNSKNLILCLSMLMKNVMFFHFVAFFLKHDRDFHQKCYFVYRF